MKGMVVVIAIIFISQNVFSQLNDRYQKKLDSTAKIVIHYLQEKQPDSIYALAGQDFKHQLSEENFKSISNSQIFPLNDFRNVTFIGTTNGINKYKVEGTPALQLLISLDKDNKLETLLIQPFSDH